MTSKSLELTHAERLPDDLAEALDQARPELDRVGLPAYFFPSTSSTNDLAGALAEQGAADGTTVIADTQTAGRGRLGRTWHSPAGSGLYLSVVVRPGLLDRRRPSYVRSDAPPVSLPSRLTLLTGVAVADAIRTVSGLPAEIKWPNDIVFAGRKLSGILAEGAVQAGAIAYIVLGIGINVGGVAFPPELADRASSIERELGKPVPRGQILARVLVNLGRARTAMRLDDTAPWFARWRELSPSCSGSLVEWRAPDGVRRGRTAGLDRDGALLVEAARGIERVLAGEVIWL